MAFFNDWINKRRRTSRRSSEELLKAALSDVTAAREYSKSHLKETHLSLILQPENWDIWPRNDILERNIVRVQDLLAATDNSDKLSSQLSRIAVEAVREAEQTIWQGMGIRADLPGPIQGLEPGFRCVISENTRKMIIELLNH